MGKPMKSLGEDPNSARESGGRNPRHRSGPRADEAREPRIGRARIAPSVRGSRAGLFHAAGRLFDQGGDCIGVGDIDGVAAGYLDDGGAGPLRHELLCGIGDHLVVADEEIPAGLRLPSRLRDSAGQGVDARRYLGVGHESCSLRIDVAAKDCGNLALSRNR